MVTGQNLPHFLIAPDDFKEAPSIGSPQTVICRIKGGIVEQVLHVCCVPQLLSYLKLTVFNIIIPLKTKCLLAALVTALELFDAPSGYFPARRNKSTLSITFDGICERVEKHNEVAFIDCWQICIWHSKTSHLIELLSFFWLNWNLSLWSKYPFNPQEYVFI